MDVETRSSGPNPYANYAVARVKRSLWGGSYIGVIGIDKRSGNPLDSFNQTSGADIYTAGQRFASLVAANPPQYYENRFAIKFTYSWRP